LAELEERFGIKSKALSEIHDYFGDLEEEKEFGKAFLRQLRKEFGFSL
jgi:hypothetical protein